MNDKELNILANKIADILLSRLEQKQREWDEEFYKDNTDMYFVPEILNESTKEILNKELNVLQKLLKKHTEDEEYLKAADVSERIKKLKQKINKL